MQAPQRRTLSPDMFSGRRVVVVAGGPSARAPGGGPGLDPALTEALRGETVIAVNGAAAWLPDAVMVVALDHRVWVDLRFGMPLREHRGLRVWVRRDGDLSPAIADVMDVVVRGAQKGTSGPWQRTLGGAMSTGGNSGHAAIQLADVLGASEIYLVGMDLGAAEDGAENGYEPFDPAPQQPERFERWHANLAAALPAIRAPLRYLDRNPVRRLAVVPTVPLAEFMETAPRRQVLIVSRHTPDYAERATKLRESCSAHDLSLNQEVVADRGSWLDNAGEKPQWLLESLQDELESPSPRHLLWLDADAEVYGDPTPAILSALEQAPLACRITTETRTGTLAVRADAEGRASLERWIAEQQARPDNIRPQRVLDRLRVSGVVRVANLPAELCAIFDLDKIPEDRWVIVHRQESRARRKRDEVCIIRKKTWELLNHVPDSGRVVPMLLDAPVAEDVTVTIPSLGRPTLDRVLRRLLFEQTLAPGKVWVWLDGMKDVPRHLPRLPKVVYVPVHPRAGAVGRYKAACHVGEGFLFSCDDDMDYPPDYIERTRAELRAHPGSVITWHGIWWERSPAVYEEREMIDARQASAVYHKLPWLSSQATSYPPEAFGPLSVPCPSWLDNGGDSWCSFQMQKAKITILRPPSEEGWLRRLGPLTPDSLAKAHAKDGYKRRNAGLTEMERRGWCPTAHDTL